MRQEALALFSAKLVPGLVWGLSLSENDPQDMGKKAMALWEKVSHKAINKPEKTRAVVVENPTPFFRVQPVR